MIAFPGSNGFIRNGRPIQIRMGQIPDVSVQAGGTSGLECYQCGLQGYRMLTPAMAALVPGGCTKVDPALCAGGTATAAASGTGAATGTNPWANTGGGTPVQGGGLAIGMGAGNLDVTFVVYRADKARPVTGVRVASSVILTSTGQVISTLPDQVAASGGAYLIHATSPAPKRDYSLKVVVSPEPGGIAFDPVTSVIPILQPNEALGSSALVTIGRGVVICPKGVLPLICEVGRKQLLYESVLKQQTAAWEVSSKIASGFISDMAHSVMRETGVSDPLLAKYWYDEMSYIVADLRIPPEDFPQLLRNYDQMKRVWNEIPWPGEGTMKGLFQRCAAGVAIHKDYRVFVDGPLYAPSMSSFFPKEDAQIRQILAMRFLSDLSGIYACMEHKIIRKAANIERQQKKWKVIGVVVSLMGLGGGFEEIFGALLKAGIALNNFNSAMEFSRFMMGYNEFMEQCATAEAKDFTCEYMGPFILWCMEAVFMGEFLDYVAIKAGLPGAREGLTQDDVIVPMARQLEDSGITVPAAARTPGGTAASTGQAMAAVVGIGGVSALALLLFGGFSR